MCDSQRAENDLYLNETSIQPPMNKFSRALFLFIGLTLNLPAQDWQLVWEDQFNGTQLDATKWAHDLGTGSQYGLWGWGNGELQSYQGENTVVSDGTLKIIAKQEPAGVVDPFNASNVMNYSSSKIITAGLFTFRYGRVQARIKTVDGSGLLAGLLDAAHRWELAL